ncbi:MAG TPA: MotA/TolQ/ExbB proton channel family protein [Thermoguttaceae bacterium]|nr:MotA/TolQ/ExbB proton channel family protein [Thermoguttaceae bacterium]HPP52906.1 MotA/TolQ/ExbB proton channel family protein [Thermoguttaceae bacterium]
MRHGRRHNTPWFAAYGRAGILAILGGLAAGLWLGAVLPLWAADAPQQTVPPPTAPQQTQGPILPESLQQFIPTRNLWHIMIQGGPLMIPIALCSVIMVAVALERMVSLRRGRIIPKPFVKRLLQQMEDGSLDRETALQLCEENGSPVAEVFAGAIRKWGRPSVEVEQAIIDAGERVTNGLRKYLRVFNGITTVAPLLGLLGTISGMIQAFNALALSDPTGRTRPQLLAEGISNALLTTAAGLCVAIPALILYLYFLSRVDRLVMEIDSLGEQLVPMICAEEMGNRAAKQGKSRRSRQETAVS